MKIAWGLLTFLLFFSSGANASVLLRNTHHTRFNLISGDQPASIWLPLPIDYETQTPLSISISISPSSLHASIEYAEDDLGNLGAWVRFSKEVFAMGASIHAEYLTLTHDQLAADRGDFYNDTRDSAEWLRSTPTVDSEFKEIRDKAYDLALQANGLMDFYTQIQNWFKNDFVYGAPNPFRLDAIGAFQAKITTCTGYANLTAALARSVGVPTRTLAGYLVGYYQQTHSINEYFIDAEYGWWRIEPQIVWLGLPEDYVMLVRVNRANDEGEKSFLPMRAGGVPRGVPLQSLVEIEGDESRVQMLAPEYFSENPHDDNHAEIQARISEDRVVAKKLFFKARKLWKRDWTQLLETGEISGDLQAIRTGLYGVKTLSDLDKGLHQIDQVH